MVIFGQHRLSYIQSMGLSLRCRRHLTHLRNVADERCCVERVNEKRIRTQCEHEMHVE